MPQERFFREDNVLYLHTPGEKRIGKSIVRTVLPPSFVNMALQFVHASPVAGHLGIARTIQRAKTSFYWLNLHCDVKEYAKSCVLCQKFMGHKVKVPPAQQWPICEDKFQRVYMDLVGPASPCGQKFICVMTDSLTRYVFTQALPDKSALSVANAFHEFVKLFECPRELVSDQGKEFLNEIMQELITFYNVSHTPAKTYRPSANGLVESKNKVIISILRFLVANDPHNWSNSLSTTTFALNTAYTHAIGDTPSFSVVAQDPKMPFDTFFNPNPAPFYDVESYHAYISHQNRCILEFLKHMLKTSSQDNVSASNKRFDECKPDFNLGDRVYIKRLNSKEHQLQSKFLGPYRIIGKSHDSVTVRNLYNSKISAVYLSHIKLCHENQMFHNDSQNVINSSVYSTTSYKLDID